MRAVAALVAGRDREDVAALFKVSLKAVDNWWAKWLADGREALVSQTVHAFGLRRPRYLGLAKTRLQHHLTGAAVNLARLDAWLTGSPLARTAPFAAFRPAG
jgi:transposase